MRSSAQGKSPETQQTVKKTITVEEQLGMVEWFRPGEYLRATQAVENLSALGVRHLRTAVPLSDWQTTEGRAWFQWLIPTLADKFEVLPCLTCSPPVAHGRGKLSELPCSTEQFADFVQAFISEHGRHFDWVDLGNPLDDLKAWDWEEELNWQSFFEQMDAAAERVRALGKKLVLTGVAPDDMERLERLCISELLRSVDAIGISGYPGTWDFNWQNWPAVIGRVQRLLQEHDLSPALWITATGYSTWRRDDAVQARRLVEALRAPVDRVYWYSVSDLPRDGKKASEKSAKSLQGDERCYHFGLQDAAGEAKFALRIWRERGLSGLGELMDTLFGRTPHPGEALLRSFQNPRNSIQQQIGLSVVAQPSATRKPILITGGAGFVGSNLAWRLAEEGRDIVILDSLQRPGVERNLEMLLNTFGNQQIKVELADIRDVSKVRKLVQNASQIYHFAAQVAVTTSLEAPREDFDVNLTGTLNILESMREMPSPPPLLFTSTNKVYGALDDIDLVRVDGRYEPAADFFARGVSEQQALDFHSPYGCSKGAADQYVLDYARSYNLPAAVFRMSCVYGPHQFGTEDQGWVAHFLIQILKGNPITLYGDGNQVRDILFVEDLVEAMVLAQKKMPELAGRAFNMGGGAANSTSLLEIIHRIEHLTGRSCDYDFADWRLGDQRYYVSDTSLFQQLTGWKPRTDISTGLRRLYEWLDDNAITQQSERPSIAAEQGVLQHGKHR
ncbi:NAD-dependent epimerase/dehydratase family protein [Proteobacteria bacterium 005FR1]|nr:NAD-dependent epimerase/dehydratase family protein [Proteobacteria bacterium 005FR1]